MKPLQSIAMGLVIVALNARVNGFDLLADPIGWALVLYGIDHLPADLRWRGTVMLLSALALGVALPLWFPGFVDTLADTDSSLVWAAGLPQLGAVALLCAALHSAAADAADRSAARWLRAARDLTVLVGTLPIVVYPVEPDLLGPLLLLAVVALVLVVVLLFRYSSRSWARPEVDQTASA